MKDGLHGISHDRILIRLVNYTQIAMAVGGMYWGSVQIVRAFDRMNAQIEILQSQVSALQGMVVNAPIGQQSRGRKGVAP